MPLQSNYWYLRNHQIFSQLTEEELKNLSVQVGLIKAQKHQSISLIKDDVKRIYFLKEGLLKIIRKEGEEEIVIDLIRKDDIFGQLFNLEVFKKSNEYVRVVSTAAIICSFTRDSFERLLSSNPALCLNYSKKIGDRLIRMQQKYTDLIFKDAKTRLFEFLVDYSQKYGIQKENCFTCKNLLTHQDLADLIGCQRQTVSILLKDLQNNNYISYNRENITVYNTNTKKTLVP